MSTTLEAAPSVEAELVVLKRMLDYSEGTSTLSIAICNAPWERDRLIAELRESHPEIDVVEIPPLLVDVYGHVMDTHPECPKAMFVIGLEASIASAEADSHTLRSLNASRDLWPIRYPCPVVFWLPEYAMVALSKQAVDFWRFVSHKFEFIGSEFSMISRRYPNAILPVENDDYFNDHSLTSVEEKVAKM